MTFASTDTGGEGLRLRHVSVISTRLEFRQQIGVMLEWAATADLDWDLKVAWRVRDAEGGSWGGVDHPLVDDGGQETSQWQPGTYHRTRHLIPLLAGLPPGPYHLEMSLYYEPTMEQSAHRQADGPWQRVPYTLADVEVLPCPLPPSLEELAILQPRREHLAEGLALLGLTPWPERLRAGETMTLELFWEAAGEDRADWAVNLQLRDAQGQTVASVRRAVAQSQYATSRWLTGERIRARYELFLPATIRPGAYSLGLSLVDQATGQESPSIPLGQVVIEGRAHRFDVPEMMHDQRALLGQEVALLGYDLSTPRLSPGQELAVTLYWQAEAEMSESYTVFVHLLDRTQRIWGQKDSPPGEGAWPTTSWVPGEVLVDRYVFPVRQDAPPGEYHLEVGMYNAATGERRPVFDTGGGRVPGDRSLLDTSIVIR